MIRALRYPRLCFASCLTTVCFAAARDLCAGSAGLSLALLYAALLLLPVCFVLISCRITVDAQGVGIGFLFRMRHTRWEDIASLGVLCCNSRRPYLYGMYREQTDFLNLLHHAPACGPWGFVAPLSQRLKEAIEVYCPFPVRLAAPQFAAPPRRMRRQWRQALLSALCLIPPGLLAAAAGVLILLRSGARHGSAFTFALSALILLLSGAMLLRRCINAVMICPGFSREGVCAGRSLYLPWENVRFAYVHRIAKMSGFYLLSNPHGEMLRRGAPPVVCLSMPDTSTLMLAYLTYCPHADRGMRP